MDQYGPAIQTLLGFVTAAPDHVRAGEFLFDAAQVAERDNQLEKAAELWERDFTQYPTYELALRALFLAGISRYRLGDYAGAFNTFTSLANSAAKLEDRAAAYLWQGKAKDVLGDKTAAKAAWELASNIDPTGYYSERARDLLRSRPPFAPPQAYDLSRDIATERTQAEAWMRATFNLGADVDLSSLGPLQSDPSFQRGAELWKLGLFDLARQEFEYLRTSMENDPAQTYRLANYLIDLGMYRSGILAARQVLTLAGMDDAATMNAPDFFNHLRFGAYFSDLIMPQAQANGFNPLFLFSVVRQESAFEGFVRSSAGARGLMQIIPATGQEVAASIGWPQGYSDIDLYRPVVSVTLGVSYLAKLRDRLDGDMYAALAAYNSGPGNASKWQELAKGDPDLFLEVIRADETRKYITQIYEMFSIYRRLYDRTP
jgi:soluble lytic murein transglycosylase